jgi:membrane protein
LLDYLDNLRVTIVTAVWGASLASLPRGRRVAVTWLRIAHMLGRELLTGTLTLRAASLVFTTLLSLVPLLAVSFSLLKAFGVHNKLEYTLFQLLDPLGERGAEFAVRIVEFVDQVKVGLLGGVGLLILFLTVISLVQKVEKALNTTWRVNQSRSFVQRFSGYLSVLLVGPPISNLRRPGRMAPMDGERRASKTFSMANSLLSPRPACPRKFFYSYSRCATSE